MELRWLAVSVVLGLPSAALADCVVVTTPGIPAFMRQAIFYAELSAHGHDVVPETREGHPITNPAEPVCANGVSKEDLQNILAPVALQSRYDLEVAASDARNAAVLRAERQIETILASMDEADLNYTKLLTRLTPAQQEIPTVQELLERERLFRGLSAR